MQELEGNLLLFHQRELYAYELISHSWTLGFVLENSFEDPCKEENPKSRQISEEYEIEVESEG